MLKVLKENEGIFNKRISGYYKNINDILFHVLDVDVSWMSDIKGTVNSKIFDDEIFKNFNGKAEPINPYEKLNEFEMDRNKLDGLIINFVDELNRGDLEKQIFLENGKTKRTWEILIHMFNHQTHHRGQISEILDENGIKNDFLNTIRHDIVVD